MPIQDTNMILISTCVYQAPKKKFLFPIAWSSKLGSVGQDFFIPSPTKLRRDIVLLPSVRHILVNTLGSTSFNGF
jgi:hypothetical protein